MAEKKINWQELIESLKKSDPRKVILFGSYSKNNASMNSDIDIFIIKDIDTNDIRTEKLLIKKQLRDFVLENEVSIDIFIDNSENIQKRIEMGDLFYKDIMQKGKVIYAL